VNIVDAMALGAGACLLGAGFTVLACSQPATLTGVQATDVAAYLAEMQECVSGSATVAAANQCVAYTWARWCGYGGSLQQLGACGADAGPDAGLPLPAFITKFIPDAGGQ
jgi:hypothetical protein